jgi:hypothetical protein
MKRYPLGEAVQYIRRDQNAPVTVKDWRRFRIGDTDILVVIVSYLQRFPYDLELKPQRMYRFNMFVNGKPRMGGYIDA